MAGCALLFGFQSISSGQSLEDKVSQARRLQAQSLLGVDDAALDSAVAAKKRTSRSAGENGESGLSDADAEQLVLDSLIAGPKSTSEYPYGDFADTLNYLEDSTVAGGKNRQRLPAHKKLPKRYEQRIFQSVNRSVFGSTSGAASRDYVLGPGDAVTLALWGDKEKVYRLIINQDGAVFVEGVGLVPIGGRNVAEAEKLLRDRLSRIYSGINRGSAFVNLSLGNPGPKRIFILGEVKVPGGYVFSGMTNVLSALYFAQGPTDIGTVRNLVLNRGGKKYSIDVYSYLMDGELPKPDVLQDGDVIFAGRADMLVEITGDVGRPATYEMKAGEGIKELLKYAGNLNPTAARQKLTLQRIFPNGKKDFVDLETPQEYLTGKATVDLQDGDKILVEKSNEPSEDFITISGPVKYPGTYESAGLKSVSQLIEKAGGLLEEAYLGRVHVVRYEADGSSKLFAYSVDKTSPDSIELKGKDNVLLYSLKVMHQPDSVEIAGAVFKPGRYEYRVGMTVKDLVMQAGGYLPHHQEGRVILFRGSSHEQKVEQMERKLPPGLAVDEQSYPLMATDFVHIPVDPRWYKKEIVTLDGLFEQPGKYALLYPGEKLADVIERAGGFKKNAYVEGGRFFRSRDSVGRVGVDVHKATESPRSKMNIPLVGGDSLYIPEKSNTVKVIGEVGFETSVLVKEGASVQYYIDRAGGFTRRSEKNRVVVQYANGETSKDGLFNRKPDAGSVIYVPQGPEPKPIDWLSATNVALGTLTTTVTLMLLINQLGN